MKTENIKIKPQWNKSKEEIWNEKFADLEDSSQKRDIRFNKRPIFYYAGVAAVILAILLPSIAFFYTKNITVPRGEHYMLSLPDGSQAVINAGSKLSYKPLWWQISREVNLEGEAYFNVEKGNRFKVYSGSETVTVLGTSFNVFSRPGKYEVACLTGKVKVEASTQSVILTKGMQTIFNEGLLKTTENSNIEEKIYWTSNKFVFNGEPLINVIREIERQYNIEVVVPENINYIYSGNFTKLDNPEQVLQIIQEPFGIKLKIKN